MQICCFTWCQIRLCHGYQISDTADQSLFLRTNTERQAFGNVFQMRHYVHFPSHHWFSPSSICNSPWLCPAGLWITLQFYSCGLLLSPKTWKDKVGMVYSISPSRSLMQMQISQPVPLCHFFMSVLKWREFILWPEITFVSIPFTFATGQACGYK